MVYARGLLTHSLADVTRLTGSRPFRIGVSRLDGGDAVDGKDVVVYWADFADLPPPPPNLKTHGRDLLYKTHLCGGVPLLEPFGPVLDWLRAQP